jgi:hypothetical protein
MAETCRTHSIAYWLHAYRQIPFIVTQPTDRPMVAGLNRATVESACQKYGRATLCDGIGWSNVVLPERICNGRYVRTASIADATALNRSRRLVLTNFDVEQVEQLWILEQLGSDLHLCSLILRLIPHGGWLAHGSNWFDIRLPPDLQRYGEQFNRRLGRFEASATGTIVDHSQTEGSVLFATYNALKVTDYANQVGRVSTGVNVRFPQPPTFVWFSFPLRSFYQTHRGFEDGFRARNGCDLPAVVFVLGGLALHALSRWRSIAQFDRYWMTALDGGASKHQIVQTLSGLAPHIERVLNVAAPSPDSIEAALRYLTLTEDKRADVEPLLAGPMFPLLPLDDTFVIDYAWPLRLLERLFFDVKVSDQNFKGDALEALVQSQIGTALPIKACHGDDGTSKQIDASFVSNDVLVVAECKALGRSVAYERGDPRAIEFRKSKLDTALGEAADKASWLASHPVGRNYQIPAGVRWICSVVVTPFVEYMPLVASKYRLNDNVSRILTPAELAEMAKERRFDRTFHNLVAIRDRS